MEYPSLLYTSGPSGHVLPEDVFEDVKLNLFFSEEAFCAMRPLCPPEDIPVRQDFLKCFMDDPETVVRFADMADTLETVRDLAEDYADARCEEERCFAFLNLSGQLLRFCALAAKKPGRSCLLWDRFHDAFSALADSPELLEVSTACAEATRRAEEVRTLGWQVAGDSLVLRGEIGENLTETLLRCADELGLTDTEGAAAISLRPATALLAAQSELYPEVFSAVTAFEKKYHDFYDPQILRYRAEMNFYLEAAGLMARLKKARIPRAWPVLSQRRRLWIRSARDISLLAKNEVEIIPNDVDFTEAEPFWYLTGANGGGKTTFLRCVGINVVLFLSGCPVAGESAELWPVTNLFTHFPRDERSDSEGRLSEEQERVDEILSQHGGDALILLNETYSAASAEDAPRLTAVLASSLADSGSFGLFITHQHALEDSGIPFLSVVIDEDEANRRTFKIERRRGAARSFAEDILKKYAMDRDSLLARFGGKEETA